MKKFILMFFLLMSSVVALDVSLTSPADASVNTTSNTIIFRCSASGDSPADLSLYTNVTATTNDIVFKETKTGSDVSFTYASIPNGMYKWNCLAKSQSNELFTFAISNRTFKVNVVAPAFTGTIPNFNWTEDSSLENAIDLATYFSPSSISYKASGNDSTIVSIKSNFKVDLTAEEDYCGIENVVIQGCSGLLCNSSNQFRLNVSCVNDAPRFSKIPNVTLSQGGSTTITLGDYFSDVENDALTYNVSLNASGIILTVNVSSLKIRVNVSSSGSYRIPVSAYDGKLYNTTSISLIISNNGNNAPIIAYYSPVLMNLMMDKGENKTFTISKTDLDNQTLTVRWYKNGQVIYGGVGDSYTYIESIPGTYEIKVEVSDGELVAKKIWYVTVNDIDSTTTTTTVNPPICGDGKKDVGEDCSNCPNDVKCLNDEECVEGMCVLQESNMGLVVGALVVIILLCGAGLVYYQFGDKIKEKFKRKPKIENDIKMEDKKEDFFGSLQSAQPVQDPIGGYITNAVSSGKTGMQIRQELKNAGWNDMQINEVFNKYNVKG